MGFFGDDFQSGAGLVAGDDGFSPLHRAIVSAHRVLHLLVGTQHTGGNLELPLHGSSQPAQRMLRASGREVVSVYCQEELFLLVVEVTWRRQTHCKSVVLKKQRLFRAGSGSDSPQVVHLRAQKTTVKVSILTRFSER